LRIGVDDRQQDARFAPQPFGLVGVACPATADPDR
jgi:hypothetical protein